MTSNNSLQARLLNRGGENPRARINQTKLWSFRRALTNDYNSRVIRTQTGKEINCLINAHNLKPDYDKKYISVDFSSGLQAGDIFQCLDDLTHWMIYLPVLTETAYLRAEIIRCRYNIELDNRIYWIYFQGPVETDARWLQEKGINYVGPNLSGSIFIKRDKTTEDYFHRFTKFKMDGRDWEVQAIDTISVPGIIELEVQEAYNNISEDLPEVKKEDSSSLEISGADNIAAGSKEGYLLVDDLWQDDFVWGVILNDKVFVANISSDMPNICTVQALDEAEGSFTLICGNKQKRYLKKIAISKNPIIEKEIEGDTEVYPYSTNIYKTPQKGTFKLEKTNKAKIVEYDSNHCSVKVLTGKKGKIKLIFTADNGDNITLPINIKSL